MTTGQRPDVAAASLTEKSKQCIRVIVFSLLALHKDSCHSSMCKRSELKKCSLASCLDIVQNSYYMLYGVQYHGNIIM